MKTFEKEISFHSIYSCLLFFSPGKSLARAAEEAALTAAQEAKHAAAAAQDFMLKAKVAAEKARRALLIAETNRQKYTNKP